MGKTTNHLRLFWAAALVAPLGFSGCNSTETADAAQPRQAEATSDSGAKIEREQMTLDVRVAGAEADKSGDSTITLDYPVLKDKNLLIPDWVINPNLGGVLGAVGVATENGLGTREQLDEARLGARLELAAMLETRLQRVGRTELDANLTADGSGRKEDSRKGTLGVDRTILDSVLAGSRQRALWFDPENGECYVWIVFDGGVLAKVDQHVEEGVSIFIANTPIETEYVPERNKPDAPTVVIELPATPEPQPEPEAPKEPIEKLEDSLEPIKSIPLREEK